VIHWLGRAREPAADGADVQQDSDDQSGIGNGELHRDTSYGSAARTGGNRPRVPPALGIVGAHDQHRQVISMNAT
jgi:hypothetical protein